MPLPLKLLCLAIGSLVLLILVGIVTAFMSVVVDGHMNAPVSTPKKVQVVEDLGHGWAIVKIKLGENDKKFLFHKDPITYNESLAEISDMEGNR